MNATPEDDQPVQPSEASEPDDLQRLIDQGPLPGVPTEAEEAEEEAEAQAQKGRKAPTHLTEDLTAFNLRMD